MQSSTDHEPYWLLAEAATWVRTRDIDQVLGINDPSTPIAITVESKQVLEELHKRCRSGGVRSVGRRCTYHDSLVKRSEPIAKPLLWRSRGEGAPSDVVDSIPPYEWADLEWESSVDGKVIGNLYLRSLRRRAWVTVQFSQSDVMREWPSHVSIIDNRPPSKTRLGQVDNRRGRKPTKLEHVKQAMRRDLSQGTDLQGMREKELAAKYGVSRDTARKARDAVVPEIVDK
jgi:hypothetical protein